MDPQSPPVDWERALDELDREGVVCLPGLLSAATCRALMAKLVTPEAAEALIETPLAEPLPDPLHRLRALLYRRVLPLARRWAGWLQRPDDPAGPPAGSAFPDTHEEHLAACRRGGRERPLCTLLGMSAGARLPLRRQPEDEPAFPVIASVLLSEPGRDFTGGELVLTEQRPRMQSRPLVVTMPAGSVALLAGGPHPQRGTRGLYRATTRHAVSRVHEGRRWAVDLRFDLGWADMPSQRR